MPFACIAVQVVATCMSVAACVSSVLCHLLTDLVATKQVEHDAGVGEVDEPVGLVEAEAGEQVARRGVAEGGVTEAAHGEVEERGGQDRDHVPLLHRLALWWRRFERVLFI